MSVGRGCDVDESWPTLLFQLCPCVGMLYIKACMFVDAIAAEGGRD